MRFLVRTLVAGLLAGGLSAAQSLQIYSEFRRVDPYGHIVPQDRGGRPREILSPLVVRNTHFTIHAVVGVPPGRHFYLYVGTNPKNVFRIQVYKEMFRKKKHQYVPDRLLPITVPYLSQIPDPYHGLLGQKVECFLIDVFVPADVPAERVKLEPQVSVDGRWALYPMEIRISELTAPPPRMRPAKLPRVREPAIASALEPLREYLCGKAERRADGRPTIRLLIHRNAMEDMALARRLARRLGAAKVAAGLLGPLGMSRAAFCAAPAGSLPAGPEWYLKARDFLHGTEPY